MSVDVSSIIAAIDAYAITVWDCVGTQMQNIGVNEAPKDTGELAGSVQWTGAAGGGGFVTGTVVVGAEYGFYTTQDELHGHPFMVFDYHGETIFARVVHPSAPDWWQNTLDSFAECISGCA